MRFATLVLQDGTVIEIAVCKANFKLRGNHAGHH